MFKKFEQPIQMRKLEEYYTIPKKYPHLAYMLINLQENEFNGVIYPTTGDLYAIADQDGLEELYRESKKLDNYNIDNIVNTFPLDDVLGILE